MHLIYNELRVVSATAVPYPGAGLLWLVDTLFCLLLLYFIVFNLCSTDLALNLYPHSQHLLSQLQPQN